MADRPLMSIHEWATYIQINPWYLNQLSIGLDFQFDEQCNGAFSEYAWQSADRLSRREIEQALYDAEMLIADMTGFFVAPRYFSETVPFPTSYNRLNYNYPLDYRGYNKSLQTRYRWIQSVGTETLTAISTENLVFSDTTGDGVNDRFTITEVVPAGTAASEIALFFTETDRNGLPLIEWEIYPITVSITGTTATITGNAWQVVKPDLRLVNNPQGLDATVAASYITQATVYRRTTNASQAGSLIWEQIGYGDCELSPCDVILHSACFIARDREKGWVAPVPATYSATEAAFTRAYPERYWRACDRVTMNYLAGLAPDSTNRIQRKYAQALAKLATALLPNRSCGCGRADLRLDYYRKMPTDEQANQVVASRGNIELAERHFGVTGRGALEAIATLKRDISLVKEAGVLWA